MAAVSAPHASGSLTPPASSNGGPSSWNFSVPPQTENLPLSNENLNGYSPVSQTNGHSIIHKPSQSDMAQRKAEGTGTSGHLAPARINAIARKESNISDTGSAPDSLLDLYGKDRSGLNSIDYGERKVIPGEVYDVDDSEHSRWIHRDKLAQIESQELQAAGFILPRTRTVNRRNRGEHSRDQQSNGYRSEQSQKRAPIDDLASSDEEQHVVEEWDLRLPDEVAIDSREEGYQDISGGVKGVSRIPVLKTSPMPIPMEHLERDKVLRGSQSSPVLGGDDTLAYGKSRGRSQSIKLLDDSTATTTPAKRAMPDNSPTKKAPIGKKGSNTRATSVPQKPNAKPPKRNPSSGQRPRTQSGELGKRNSITKPPEGDPPWLTSMYKPDPRLPPDQQLLPTVARRLQQEQWEKEGKVGTVYDTQFRPLNGEELPQRHVPPPLLLVPESQPKAPGQRSPGEWPLKAPKSPALNARRPSTANRTESYSVMPKLTAPHTGTPQGIGPLPSPKPPVDVPNLGEDAAGKKQEGCGCCVIM